MPVRCNPYFCSPQKKFFFPQAKVAHLVEHDLAKVGVAGSSPVFRSELKQIHCYLLFFSSINAVYPGGGIGRHAGLKILFAAMRVWVQLPSWVLLQLVGKAFN